MPQRRLREKQSTAAEYLAERMCAEKGCARDSVPEARTLAEASDILLTKADGLTFSLTCVVDRDAHPERRFPLDRDAVVAAAQGCLGYTGSINGAKMPVAVQIWEVGRGAGAESDWPRLKAYSKRFAGRAKVVVSAWALDPESGTVRSTLPFHGLLGGRRFLERCLREPRRAREDGVLAPAAIEEKRGPTLATYAVLAVLALVFVAEIVFGVRPWSGPLAPDIVTLVAAGGLFAPAVQAGEWHRFFAAVLLHGDVFHLVFNGIALWLGGVVLEALLGPAWFLALFTLGALGGSALSYALNPAELVSVGASGAIMGLLAAAFAVAFRLPQGAERMSVQMRIAQILIPSLLPLFAHRAGMQIDYGAHLGGAIVGGVVGYGLMRSWPRADPVPPFRPPARAVAVAGALLFAVSLGLAATHFHEYAQIGAAEIGQDALPP